MAEKYDVVTSKQELRDFDDSEKDNGRGCLVEGYSWYFLDRNCLENDDGDGYITPLSGMGRWVIMTSRTQMQAAALAKEYNLDLEQENQPN